MDRLKEKFYNAFTRASEDVKSLLANHGTQVIDEVTVNQIYGGMRGLKSMVWETSLLDAETGIRFRGLSIPDLRLKLPKINDASEPNPEGLFWLMLTGELPSEEDVIWLSDEWKRRAVLPENTYRVIEAIQPDVHPMTQFSMGILSMQKDSVFF